MITYDIVMYWNHIVNNDCLCTCNKSSKHYYEWLCYYTGIVLYCLE
jgi:hypothetical protein